MPITSDFTPRWVFLPSELQNSIILQQTLKLSKPPITDSCMLRGYRTKLAGTRRTVLIPSAGSRVNARMWQVTSQRDWNSFCACLKPTRMLSRSLKGKSIDLFVEMEGTCRRLRKVEGFAFVWQASAEANCLQDDDFDFVKQRREFKETMRPQSLWQVGVWVIPRDEGDGSDIDQQSREGSRAEAREWNLAPVSEFDRQSLSFANRIISRVSITQIQGTSHITQYRSMTPSNPPYKQNSSIKSKFYIKPEKLHYIDQDTCLSALGYLEQDIHKCGSTRLKMPILDQ
jgi:hypothetical protein